jgi:hypothetical protein
LVVLLGGALSGSVLVIMAWLFIDLAASACLLVDLPVVIAGTGLTHQLA